MKKYFSIIIFILSLSAFGQAYKDQRGIIRMLYGGDTLNIMFSGDTNLFTGNIKNYEFDGGVAVDSIKIGSLWYSTLLTPSNNIDLSAFQNNSVLVEQGDTMSYQTGLLAVDGKLYSVGIHSQISGNNVIQSDVDTNIIYAKGVTGVNYIYAGGSSGKNVISSENSTEFYNEGINTGYVNSTGMYFAVDLIVRDTTIVDLIKKYSNISVGSFGFLDSIYNTVTKTKLTQTKLVVDTVDATTYLNIYALENPVDSITFNPNIVNLNFHPWTIKADTVNHTFTVYLDESEISPQLFLEHYIIGYNNTGSTISNLTAVYSDSSSISSFGNFKLPIATDVNQVSSVSGIATHDIEPGTIGFATRFGNLKAPGHGFPINSILHLSDTLPGGIVDYSPMAPNYSLRLGKVLNDSIIQVSISSYDNTDTEVNLEGYLNGIVTEAPGFYDTIIGGVPYVEVYNETEPTKNLPFIYNGVRSLLNTTTNTGTNGRARVAVTLGTESNPQINHIYIDNSGTPTLTANTTATPTNGIALAECAVNDITTHSTYGFSKFQRFNNAVDGSNAQGLMYRTVRRIRLEGSKYESGVNPTVSIVSSAGLDSLNIYTTSGIVSQFNSQTFDAQTQKKYYWFNCPSGGKWITDLAQVDSTSLGASLRGVNIRYGLNIFLVQNSSPADDIILVASPRGSYSNDNNAINDVNNYAVTTVPATWSKTAIRGFRLVVNYTTAGGGTITNLLGAGGYQDERGQPLGTTGTGSTSGAAQTNFSDANFTIFDNLDPTKIVNFQASGLTTGTTRTQTFQDKSGVLAHLSDLPVIDTTNIDSLHVRTLTLSNNSIINDSVFYLEENTSGNYFDIQLSDQTEPYIDYFASSVGADVVWSIYKDVFSISGDDGVDAYDISLNTINNNRVFRVEHQATGVPSTLSYYQMDTTKHAFAIDNIELFKIYKDSSVLNKPKAQHGFTPSLDYDLLTLKYFNDNAGGGGLTASQVDSIARISAIDTIANADSLNINGSLRGARTIESFATSKSINYFLDHYKEYTATGNTTITVTGVPYGFHPTLALIVDATGGYTLAISGATKWSSTNSIDNTANAINLIQFKKIGSTIYYFVTTHNP